MNTFDIGQRVVAATMRGEKKFEGEILKIEDTLRGAWYHVKRDLDGLIIKVRAAKMRLV